MRGIYKITNTNNGKCYIGKSEDLGKRLRYHTHTLQAGYNKNKHMQDAYNKSDRGTFTVEILEDLNPGDDINEREKYWIKYYKSNDNKYGYNKTDGGDGGNSYTKYMSEEELNELFHKQAEGRRGEKNPNYGKHCFTDGVIIKYIADNEIEEYLNNGWIPGVPDHVRNRERIANTGEKNGFYGKKHLEETRHRLSEIRMGENNRNYGMVIMHKGNKQKYVDPNDIDEYLKNGWEKGMRHEIIKKISDSKKGKKKSEPNITAKKYLYDEKVFYGWKRIQQYLRENGYPKISETAIVKLANGGHVRGYDDLYGKITITF